MSVSLKMYFGKMLVEQIFQPLLLLIAIGQFMGWSEFYVLADRAISPERQFACSTHGP